jgi:hypothetical protein
MEKIINVFRISEQTLASINLFSILFSIIYINHLLACFWKIISDININYNWLNYYIN